MAHNGSIREADSEERPDLKFHSVHSNSIKLEHGNKFAVRRDKFRQGFAFSNRPISIDERVCLQLNKTLTVDSLRWGVTTVAPQSVDSVDLFDRDTFIRRRSTLDYWMPNWVAEMSEGSLVQFCVSDQGEIRCFVGRIGEIAVLRDIPSTQPLWVVLDLCGRTSKVEFVSPRESQLAISMRLLQRNCGSALRGIMSRANERNPRIEGFLSVFGGKSGSRSDIGNRESIPHSSLTHPERSTEMGTTVPSQAVAEIRRTESIGALNDAFQLHGSTVPTAPLESPPLSRPPDRMVPPQQRRSPVRENPSECSICFDAVINSVFISCGHMCACLECAMRIKNETNTCPICRKVIRSVCQTYNSC